MTAYLLLAVMMQRGSRATIAIAIGREDGIGNGNKYYVSTHN